MWSMKITPQFCHLLLLFLSSFFYSNCQTYEFNRLLMYNRDYDHILLTNTENKNILLEINRFMNFSHLIDRERLEHHVFQTTQERDIKTNKTNFVLKHNKKTKINSLHDIKWYNNLVTKLVFMNKIDEKLNRYVIEMYKNPKKKKPFLSIEIEAEETNKDFFYAFKKIAVHPFENHPKFNVNKNLLIWKAEYQYEKKDKITIILKEFSEVDVKVNIQETQN